MARSALHQRDLMEGRGPLGACVYVPPVQVQVASDLDCAVCHDNREVAFNPGIGVRDPQADDYGPCPGCGGTGSEADRLEREANPSAYPEDPWEGEF